MSRHTPSPVQLFTCSELSALREIRQQVSALSMALESMMEADAEYDLAYKTLKDYHNRSIVYHTDQLQRTVQKAQSVAVRARMAVFTALDRYMGGLEPSEALEALSRMDSNTHYRIMCLMSDPTIR